MAPAKNLGRFSALFGTPAGQQGGDEADLYYPPGRFLNYRPVFGQICAVLTSVSSVLTIMPISIRPTDPWARDLAALRGDMAAIGRDAWTVIARHENERRRQEG